MTRKLSDEEATARMLASDIKPLAPYPGAVKLWPCECLICGTRFEGRLQYVTRGDRGCPQCFRRHQAEMRIRPEDEAVSLMRAAGLEPLEPYPGGNFNWKCRCLGCGAEVSPKARQVQAGTGGCRKCGGRKISAANMGDPKEAEQILRKAGLEPLAPYPGNKAHWWCFCLGCASVLRPRLSDIKRGSACPHCAKYGFDPVAPAVLYVLFHDELGATKIGITATGAGRIKTFMGRGWSCFKVLHFPDGSSARAAERAVLAHVRDELGIGPHLTRGVMRYSGFTETFSSDELPPAKAWDLAQRFAAEDRLPEGADDGLAA